MIRTFRHRGVGDFFHTGKMHGIQPKHASRLRKQLLVLDYAQKPRDVDRAGWRLHPLKGQLADHWAVSVDRSWRLTFTFVGTDVFLVDYQDYH